MQQVGEKARPGLGGDGRGISGGQDLSKALQPYYSNPPRSGQYGASTPCKGADSVSLRLEPYVKAMLGASGLDEDQGRTCVYYALATYHIKTFDKFPILAFVGGTGTGKSSAMRQVGKMADRPKEILGQTYATVRDELSGVTTALIDESDYLHGLENLLTYRYGRETGEVTVNRGTEYGGYVARRQNIFGATVVAKRKPFRDVAMRSRAIIVRTRMNPGKYQITEVKALDKIAAMIRPEAMETCNRVQDTWKPLLAVAQAAKDEQWLKYAYRAIDSECRQLKLSQGIEPSEALLHALKAFQEQGQERAKLSAIRDTLKTEFDVRLIIPQILDLLQGLGFRVVAPKGYHQAIIDAELLDRLISEMEAQETEGG